MAVLYTLPPALEPFGGPALTPDLEETRRLLASVRRSVAETALAVHHARKRAEEALQLIRDVNAHRTCEWRPRARE